MASMKESMLGPVDMQRQILGRWCGVADTSGSGHIYFILNIKSKVKSNFTVTRIIDEESTTIEDQ